MGSSVISIPIEGETAVDPPLKGKENNNVFKISLPSINFSHPIRGKKTQSSLVPIFSSLSKDELRKIVHSIKVGIALVLVSFLYLLDPLYQHFGDNAMWAVMTVVVVFEFSAGATLSKGLNRGIGTILGGGLGYLAAASAQVVRGAIGKAVIVGSSVFMFGAVATYFRLFPSIKKKYDYGVMIFILTFNLVVVSGIRAEEIMELARDRLLTIVIGFVLCIFVSLLVLPQWAGDELNELMASKFEHLASTIEGCLEEYVKPVNEMENKHSACKLVLNSKSRDETLANFAKWEPWHGRFGFSYPWDKYLKIGDLQTDLAALLSLKSCLQSRKKALELERKPLDGPCDAIGSSLPWALRVLGQSIKHMKKCPPKSEIGSKLKATRQDISSAMCKLNTAASMENGDRLAIATLLFLLMEIVERVEELAKEVEELGVVAGFQT